MFIFIQFITSNNLIFIKNKYFYYLECKIDFKIQNTKAFNKAMDPMISKLFNIKKVKLDFHEHQQSSILVAPYFLFNTPFTGNQCDTEQMHLISNTRTRLRNSSLPVHISTQTHPTIFEDLRFEYFSFFTHFLCHIFYFSPNNKNIYCSTNSAISFISNYLIILQSVEWPYTVHTGYLPFLN